MSEALGVETRRRSRSKTPGILSQENGDSEKRSKKIPTISLIDEEDDVIEVPSSQSTRPKRQRRSKPTADSENQSPKESQKITKAVKTINGSGDSNEQTTITTSTVTVTTSETRTNGGTEDQGNQSIFNNIFTAIKTSTPILSSKKTKRRTELLSKEINVADHPAYKEYKEAGEYWNKYPKTDYTYSELSPHRRELSNGIVAMPNMSRKSLENHQNRVEMMIHNNPLDETYLRKKFLSTSVNTSFQKRSADLLYDSADEVDLTEFRKQLRARRQRNPKYLVQSFFLSIVSFFSSIYYRARNVFVKSSYQPVYTPVRRPYQRGIFSRAFESVQQFFLVGFSKVYLFISTILCFDTWLLYTRSENAQENRKRKRFLLGMLALLPLLLFGAFLLSDDTIFDDFVNLLRIDRFAFRKSFTDLLPTMPSLPSIDFNFSLSWLWPSIVAFGTSLRNILPSRSSSSEQLRMSMDEDKFQALLAHIDQYIDKAIGVRIDERHREIVKELNEKFTLIIANTVENKFTDYQYKLNEKDLEMISGRLNLLINENDKILMNKLSKLNEENLKILQQQVQNDLHIHLNDVKFEKQDINIDGIISSIFQSNKFSTLINDKLQQILARLDQHDNEISSIKLDLTNLRDEVVSKFSLVNDDFTTLSNALRNTDENVKLLKIENAAKIREILILVDEKIKTSSQSQFPSIDSAVKQNVLKLFGYSDTNFDEKSIKDWISGIFVARNYLEERLSSLELNQYQNVKIQIDKSSESLMNDISEKIKNELNIEITNKVKDLETSRSSSTTVGALNEDAIIKIVKDILKIYDADKTGLVDFALETAGGQVISTRCTETYRTKSAEISIFGIPLWYPSNTPRTVITPSVHPGECWAFQGFPGFLVVQLNNLVEITGFTIEHIPKSLAPNGIIDSAPNNFSVWGLLHEMDKDPIHFGNYQFSNKENSPSLQYFPVANREVTQPYQFIELRIESNHGNPKYTCLYRFRVHGNVAKR